MNPIEDYFYLGKIINPNGYKGKLNAYLDTDDPSSYSDLKTVFLLIDGLPVPHFIESIKITNNKAVLELKNVDKLEKAQALTQTDLYLPISELPPLSGNKFYYHEVIGFVVLDEKYGKLGEVKHILEYPNQAVFQIIFNSREILIPINNEIIRTVDRKNKEIHILAPDGLIDIYTS